MPDAPYPSWIGKDCPPGWTKVDRIDLGDLAAVQDARDRGRRIGTAYDGHSGFEDEPCTADVYVRRFDDDPEAAAIVTSLRTTREIIMAGNETSQHRSWYYFGCHEHVGHYLFNQNMRTSHCRDAQKFVFDGNLCLPENDGLYLASLTRLGGLGYSALAFWDRTMDKRPGSNSAIFAPSLVCSPETILRGAEAYFPAVFKRWPAIDLTRANDQFAAMLPAGSASS